MVAETSKRHHNTMQKELQKGNWGYYDLVPCPSVTLRLTGQYLSVTCAVW